MLINLDVVPSVGTTAQFRAYGGAISNTINTLGWVKSSDVGQIDWSTVAGPTTANQVIGFEIWRMDDSLSSSSPVYLKIEYGSGDNTAYPSIWFTIGAGSDGSGSLTGITTIRRQLKTNNSTVTAIGFASGNSGRLLIAVSFGRQSTPSTISTHLLISIERTCDNSGADTGAGVLIFSHCTGSAFRSLYWDSAGPRSEYTVAAGAAPNAGTGARGNDVAVFPLRCWMPAESCPSRNLAAYFAADLTALNPVAMNLWTGQQAAFIPTSGLGAPWVLGGNTQICMRYD